MLYTKEVLYVYGRDSVSQSASSMLARSDLENEADANNWYGAIAAGLRTSL